MAIRTAKAMVEEVPQVATSSIGNLAKCREDHSEREVHSIAKRFSLTIPVPLSQVQIGGDSLIPFIKMSAWVNFIFKYNLWHRLCGLRRPDMIRCGEIWKSFWSRYKGVNPGHEIFQRPGHDFSRTCGLLLHGDEGRSLRKSALMVVSCHSILGFGLSTAKQKLKKKYVAQKLNYEEPSWTTRFLLSVLPKQYCNEDNETCWESDPFQDLMAAISQDLRDLFDQGIETPEGRFYFCIVNVMGDWPFEQKCGNLARSYLNTSKAASSRTAPKGICHLCCADMPHCSWENFDDFPPTWLPTVNTVSAFSEPPAVLQLPKNNDFEESLFYFDLFHAWHIGAGKTFLASCLSLLISSPAYQGGIDLRCEQVTADYAEWSRSTGFRCQLRKISKAKLGGLSSTAYPTGCWSKGSKTRVLMKFFIAACLKYQDAVQGDILFQLAQRAATRMEQFLHGIYSWEIWIPSDEAKPIIEAGLSFLKIHYTAVKIAYARKVLLFQLMPNYHRIHHLMWEMYWQAQQLDWVLNPLFAATQSDEDFIGRPSRVSRRVSPRLTIERTLQRSLLATYSQYINVGALILDQL